MKVTIMRLAVAVVLLAATATLVAADPTTCTSDEDCECSPCATGYCALFYCVCDPDDSLCADSEYCDEEAGCISQGDCDDGIDCTVDRIIDGICTHSEDDISACDDDIWCTLDYCSASSGGCVYQELNFLCDAGMICDSEQGCIIDEEGDPCDDHIECTTDMPQADGSCIHAEDDSKCDDDDATTRDSCNSLFGCVNEDLICDDGVTCNYDFMIDEVCEHFDLLDDACDDGIECTWDVCDTDSGGCQHQPNNLLCDVGEACDEVSGCVATECDDGIDCTVDTVLFGECVSMPDSSACDDGIDCTIDTCHDGTGDDAGGCVFDPADYLCDSGYTCVPEQGGCQRDLTDSCDDGIDCTEDSLDPATGVCNNIPDDTACDDDDDGTIDTCHTVYGCLRTLAECDDGIDCTLDYGIDFLGQVTCFNTQDHTACDDGVDCTLDTCLDDGCEFEPLDWMCPEDGDVCDLVLGCVERMAEDPLICNDGNPCTDDRLVNGTCVWTPTVCDDLDPRTKDSCNATIGCIFKRDDGSFCQDGDVCTMDFRAFGMCNTYPVICDDDDDSTDDWCDSESGSGCVHAYKECHVFNNTCSVGTPVNGTCVYEALDCDDHNEDTIDSCHPSYGCAHSDPSCDGSDDDDSADPCTMSYLTEDGEMCVRLPVVCDDDDSCTEDSCDPDAGCVFHPISGCGDSMDSGVEV